MAIETQEIIDLEELQDGDDFEHGIELDHEHNTLDKKGIDASVEEINSSLDEAPEPLEPGKQAVLDQKGGQADDWGLEYKGDSGYHFDGHSVRDPEGKVWINEDAALHHEMLSQWAEGGSAIFFLPDYKETTEDKETLYVTMMILGEQGDVTYEIHKHETFLPKYSLSVDIDQGSMSNLDSVGFELEDIFESDEVAEIEHIESFENGSAERQDIDTEAEMNQGQILEMNTTEDTAPDQWLVDLLALDALDDIDVPILNEQKTFPEPVLITTALSRVEQSSETVDSARTVDSPKTASTSATSVPDAQLLAAELLYDVSKEDVKAPPEISQHEQPHTTLGSEVLSGSEKVQEEPLDVDISISDNMVTELLRNEPDGIEINNADVVIPEVAVKVEELVDTEVAPSAKKIPLAVPLERIELTNENTKKTGNNETQVVAKPTVVVETTVSLPNVTSTEKSNMSQDSALIADDLRTETVHNHGKETETLKAAEVLRKLGIPFPTSNHESAGLSKMPASAPHYVPSDQGGQRCIPRRDRPHPYAGRVSEKDGITMNMAA